MHVNPLILFLYVIVHHCLPLARIFRSFCYHHFQSFHLTILPRGVSNLPMQSYQYPFFYLYPCSLPLRLLSFFSLLAFFFSVIIFNRLLALLVLLLAASTFNPFSIPTLFFCCLIQRPRQIFECYRG